MAAIWEQTAKYQIWLQIETLACHAQSKLGLADPKIIDQLRHVVIDPQEIARLEQDLGHDVLAFLTAIAQQIGPNEARFLHQGMTSSDVLDTALAVQLVRSCDLLLEDLDRLRDALTRRAKEHKKTLCVGRSHGIHAEPTTFGLKLASHYAAFDRHRRRLRHARSEIAVCAISGTVGTYATIDPFVEAYVADNLGLIPETISTQVIPRDRHAFFFSVLGVIAASIEALAIEIRHLQRTEVNEVQEPFSRKQKGSSAMPHKRNPILSENLSGLGRLIRSMVPPSLENVILWHERDISHSSVERGIAPDICVTLDFALNRLTDLIARLIVHPQRMRENLNFSGGLIYSHRVLLALIQTGLSREDAYHRVQTQASRRLDNGASFFSLLLSDPVIQERLGEDGLKSLFDPYFYLQQLEIIFDRVWEKSD